MKINKTFLLVLPIVSLLYDVFQKSLPKTSVYNCSTINYEHTLVDSGGCGEIAYEILLSSHRYKEQTKGLYEAVVKNGGTSYGVTFDGSPSPKQDKALEYSKTYDFSLHETYPDHNHNIALFTFDKKANRLYEHDTAADSLIPIEFDINLLHKFNKTCY
jgi:hypothetical protein